MRFSRKYESFEQWANKQIAQLVKDSTYYTRIRDYVTRNPGATLAEARGHAPPIAREYRAAIKEEIQKAVEKEVPPEEEILYRSAVGIKNIPIHKEYYGCLLSAFSYDEDYLEELRVGLENRCFPFTTVPF